MTEKRGSHPPVSNNDIAHTIRAIPSSVVLNISAHHTNARCKNTLETLINPKTDKMSFTFTRLYTVYYVHNIECHPKALNVG